MTRTTTRLTIIALACLTAAGAVAPRTLGAQAGSLVKIDFLAVGADGKPVTDLKPDQVSLKVAGRDRVVKSLELVRAADAAVGAAPAASSLPEPFGSNSGSGGGGGTGRHFLFAVEDEGLRAGIERQVRDAVSQMIGGMTPRDRVSLAVLPRGAVRVDPTTTHTLVNDALTKVVGRLTNEGTDERACRTRDTLDALRNALAAAGAGPTTVVFFSSTMAGQNRTGGANASNRCELTTSDFQKMSGAVDGARATVYVVNPDTSANTNQDGLENLAGVTGGQFIRLTTDANPLGRVVTETSAYYVASFETDASDRAGQMQRMDLRVTREGVTTRARADVSVGRAAATPGATPSVRDLVRGTQTVKDLPLRATAYASMDTDGQKMKVLIAIETDPGVKLTSAAAGVYDTANKGTIWTANAEELARPMVLAALSLPKGMLRLRVAASDGARTGTVDTTVNADVIAAGPMQLSGLVLGSAASGAFAPKLQFGSADAEAIAYFELYGQDPKLPMETLVEIAATADGPAIVSSPVTLGAGGVNRYTATAVLPLAKLAPGDYVVRAKFTVQGHPPGVVTRTLRKTN